MRRKTLICFLLLLVGSGASAQNLPKNGFTETLSIEIPYGTSEGELGFVNAEETPKIGPSSFTSDSEGNIYICDTVNKRIQIYSNAGAYQSTVDLPEGITPNDLIVDGPKGVFIYDHAARKLYRLSRRGKLLHSFKLDQNDLSCLESMHIVENKIYRRTCDGNDIQILEKKKELPAISVKESKQMPGVGIISLSKRRYAIELTKGKKSMVYRHDEGGTKKLMQLDINKPLSLKFLAEDKNGNFYLRTERLEGKDVILEVRKYNTDGELLSVLLIEDTDYATWPIRLFQVDNDGQILQLVPGTKSAKLHVFSPLSL